MLRKLETIHILPRRLKYSNLTSFSGAELFSTGYGVVEFGGRPEARNLSPKRDQLLLYGNSAKNVAVWQ